MTRAKQTLTLFPREDAPNPYCELLESKLSGDQLVVLAPQIEKPIPENVLKRRYDIIGMKDVYLDYAGRMPSSKSVHHHLAQTCVGELIQLKRSEGKLEVCNSAGHLVVTLSREATDRWMVSLEL